MEKLSYHHVAVYCGNKRYKVSDNYALLLQCTRCSGWQLWHIWDGKKKLLGGEYEGEKFCITVNDRSILGSIPVKHKVEDVDSFSYGFNGIVNNPRPTEGKK